MNAVRSLEPFRALRTAPLLGPAFVAAIAYVDPGNFATNFAAGLRVRLPAALGHRGGEPDRDADPVRCRPSSASRRAATCPRPAGDTFPRPVSIGLWVQAEMRRDRHRPGRGDRRRRRAEPAVRAAAAARRPGDGRRRLRAAGAAGTRAPAVRARGRRACFARDRLRVPDHAAAGRRSRSARWRRASCRASPAPRACCWPPGILGATVMPHVIYLHSALTCRRDPARHPRAAPAACCPAHRRGVLVAMGLAGLVNAAMLIVAAALFHGSAHPGHRHPGGGATPAWPGRWTPRPRPCSPSRCSPRVRVLRRGHLRGPGRHAGLRPAADPAVRSAAR